jgi:hypothetical protein
MFHAPKITSKYSVPGGEQRGSQKETVVVQMTVPFLVFLPGLKTGNY